MPISNRCPLGAKWGAVDPTSGQMVDVILQPEDILQMIADGYTPEEIAMELEIEVDPVNHCIAEIPMMMKWRQLEAIEIQKSGGSVTPGDAKTLPAWPPSK